MFLFVFAPLKTVTMLCLLIMSLSETNTCVEGVSVIYLGDNQYDPSVSNLEVTENEISGLVWFRNNIFYGISDELNIDNKGWIKYEYNINDFSFTPIFGQIIGEHPYGDASATDSEQISVLGLPFENGFYDDGTLNTRFNILESCYSRNDQSNALYAYFLIAKEGWRPLARDDRILLYRMDGTYIKEFNFPSLYTMTDTSGSQNNGGFEALYISKDYSTLLIANELPLLQDQCEDDAACVRISVGSINGNTAQTINDVNVNWEYMYRYDAVSLDWEVKDVLLLDKLKYNQNCKKSSKKDKNEQEEDTAINFKEMGMPALVLESFAGDDGIRDFDIFLVDLDIKTNGVDNVLNCFSLSGDCSNSKSLTKISIFSNDENRGLPNDINFDFTLLNFESMALIDNKDEDKNLDINGYKMNKNCVGERLILSNDNAEITDNFFITYLLNYC